MMKSLGIVSVKAVGWDSILQGLWTNLNTTALGRRMKNTAWVETHATGRGGIVLVYAIGLDSIFQRHWTNHDIPALGREVFRVVFMVSARYGTRVG